MSNKSGQVPASLIYESVFKNKKKMKNSIEARAKNE